MSNWNTLKMADTGEHITTVTLHRPERRNAIDREMIGELEACFTALAARRAVRAVVLIGAGINVNCIAAGAVATEAWAETFEKMGDALRRQVLQMVPAGRLGTVSEIASLAVYLASDDAAYIVGQVISPSGGLVT